MKLPYILIWNLLKDIYTVKILRQPWIPLDKKNTFNDIWDTYICTVRWTSMQNMLHFMSISFYVLRSLHWWITICIRFEFYVILLYIWYFISEPCLRNRTIRRKSWVRVILRVYLCFFFATFKPDCRFKIFNIYTNIYGTILFR